MSHNFPIEYKYMIADLRTGVLVAEVPFSAVTWSKKVKAAGEFTGTVGVSEEFTATHLFTIAQPGKNALYIIRNGEVVWGGIIWTRRYAQSDHAVVFTASTFEVYLHHRILWRTRTYAAVDLFNIVRDLLNAISVDFDPNAAIYAGSPNPYQPLLGYAGRPLNSDIGIILDSALKGAPLETNSEDFRGSEMKYVGEAIDAMTDNQAFFEYRIVPSYNGTLKKFEKSLQLYTPADSGLASNLVFEYPGNIATFDYDDTMEGAATRYWVTGAGDDAAKAIGSWTNDTYLDNGLGWPIYDEVESSEHASTVSVLKLQGYAQTLGERAVPPIITWAPKVFGGLDPKIGTYLPGDWAKFIIKDHAFGGTQAFTRRITEMKVEVPDTDATSELVTLTLSRTAFDENL